MVHRMFVGWILWSWVCIYNWGVGGVKCHLPEFWNMIKIKCNWFMPFTPPPPPPPLPPPHLSECIEHITAFSITKKSTFLFKLPHFLTGHKTPSYLVLKLAETMQVNNHDMFYTFSVWISFLSAFLFFFAFFINWGFDPDLFSTVPYLPPFWIRSCFLMAVQNWYFCGCIYMFFMSVPPRVAILSPQNVL